MKNHPVQQLVDEHRYIMAVVRFLETLPPGMSRGEPVDTGLLGQVVTFMREFADHCHHAKEEDQLFPALVAAGAPESGCPIGGLKGEHARGRQLVGALEQGLERLGSDEQQARAEIQDAIAGIVKLYPDHIWKEDQMVFPMADRLLGSDQLAALEEGFNRVEREHHEAHHLHMAFALELEKRLRDA